MIIGTGIDIVEVSRIAEKISRENGFREKVFSAHEIAYCELMANPAEHYAARFATKESFLKATGKGLLFGYDLYEIEVKADSDGKPSIYLSGSMAEKAQENNWTKIHVSLSHVQSMACAVVIIEG